MLVLYSPRESCPRSPRLTSTTTTARLDTPTRYYSARPRSSKGSFSKESCWSAEGAPWRKFSAKVSRIPHKHEQIRSSGEFLWILSGPKVVESFGRKRYTLIVRDDVVGVFYAPQVRRRGNGRAVPSGYSCRRCSFQVVTVRTDGVGSSLAGSLNTCVDHEVSIRNSPRPAVPNSMG